MGKQERKTKKNRKEKQGKTRKINKEKQGKTRKIKKNKECDVHLKERLPSARERFL